MRFRFQQYELDPNSNCNSGAEPGAFTVAIAEPLTVTKPVSITDTISKPVAQPISVAYFAGRISSHLVLYGGQKQFASRHHYSRHERQ